MPSSALANGTGCRKLGEVTMVPSRIDEVATDAAANVVMASNQGGRGTSAK